MSKKLLHTVTTLLVALFWGSLSGRICYDNFSYFMFMYSNSRTYYDVVPSMPAASVADAGRLVFAKEARVDKVSSVGYAGDDGKRYCVAPIRDMSDSVRVEYWAIGYDCCDWLGGFACGNAGDSEARGGARVFNHSGVFGQKLRMDHFESATRKAAATFDLIATDKPFYVYWVDNAALESLSGGFKLTAWIFILITTLVFGVLFCLLLSPRYSKHPGAGGGLR
jgi:hypothetical protein